MDGEFGPAFFQRGLELLHEQALAAHLGQGPVKDLVTAGGHAQQLDLQTEALAQECLDVFGLPQGQATFTRGNAQGGAGN